MLQLLGHLPGMVYSIGVNIQETDCQEPASDEQHTIAFIGGQKWAQEDEQLSAWM
jgi:hypothetical protein